MGVTVDISEIEWGSREYDYRAFPEELFFQDLENGILRNNTLPLPEGVSAWTRCRYKGEEVHCAQVGNMLFMLADTTNYGYTLFRFVSQPENELLYRVAYQKGSRPITETKRSLLTMSNNSLAAAVQRFNQGGVVAPMSLDRAPMMGAVAGEGISHNVDERRLRSEILSHAYVAGYVMANAPALTMSLSSKKAKDGNVTSNIVAKESKPSRCLKVLMSLPAHCVQKNGNLASPEDILNNQVDFGQGNRGEMLHMAFSTNAAIAYINAMGGKIAEYAPHVTGAKAQWTPEEILSGKADVSFVYVRATENKGRSATAQDRFRFSLKTTSGRRSLYTEGNIVCLRILEHVPTKVNSQEDEYNLNNMAFGAWRYRQKKTETQNALQKAMTACPSQIWEKQYEINGKTVEGIGSAFFMEGSSTKSASGEMIAARPLTYMPWYQTGDQRSQVGTRVDRIVKRTLRPADGDKKEAMVTSPLTFKEHSGDKRFQVYGRFIDFIITQGYMSRETLMNLGSRTSKAKTKSLRLTPDQENSLAFFVRSEAVEADIQALRNEAADRAVLAEAKG